MSERYGQQWEDFSGPSPEQSHFSERRHFVDPALLEATTSMADAVAYSGITAGLGVLAAGAGIGWYFYKRGEAVERESKKSLKDTTTQGRESSRPKGTA